MTSSEDPREGFMELVVRYLDGGEETALDECGRQELNRVLRQEARLRRELALLCTHAWLLRETYLPEHVGANRPGRIRRRRFAVASVLVLLASCIALAVFRSRKPGDATPAPPGTVIATLGAVTGGAWVTSPGTEAREARAGGEIRSGDAVRLDGPGATAELIYPDGTRLLLVGRTSVNLVNDPAKSIALHEGTMSAVVTPQPAEGAMTLTTPAARLRVVGTEFSLSAEDSRTELRVSQGKVALTRHADGKSVEVSSGKSVVAEAEAALVVRDVSGPPDIWELGFEEGLPAGMTRGRWVSDGLPRGSRGGVAAVRRKPGKEGVYFEIGTAEMWQDGFFAVHPDSHFHCTFKMARPGWLNIFVICRRFESSGPQSVNYMFDELEFHRLGPNRWWTVSIPLSRFKRLANVPGEPFANQTPYVILLSAQEPDRGLVIDRMWVTRGGAGKVVYRDVE